MLDKDKRIIVCNLYVGEISRHEILDYIASAADALRGYFDDSVKIIFNQTTNEDKPLLEVVSDFPVDAKAKLAELLNGVSIDNIIQDDKIKKIIEQINKTDED